MLDLTTVELLRGLTLKSSIDGPSCESVVDAVAETLAAEFVYRASGLGIDIGAEDVEHRMYSAWGRGVISVTAHWSPATCEVELLGGPLDGEVICASLPCAPLELAVPAPSGSTEPRASATYKFAGWRERTGRWVSSHRS